MFILILLVLGGMSSNDTSTVASVPGFQTRQSCFMAGRAVEQEFRDANRRTRWKCVQQ